jgi:hypothetical protein
MIDLITPWIAKVGQEARARLREAIQEGSAPRPSALGTR